MEIQDPVHIHKDKNGLSFIQVSNLVSDKEAKIVLFDQLEFNFSPVEVIQAYLDLDKELYIDSTYELMESTTVFKICELKNIDKITYFYNPRTSTDLNQTIELLKIKGLTCVPRQYFADYMNVYEPVYEDKLVNKTFLCLNGKLTAERIFLVSLLSQYNLLQHGYVSLFDEKNNLFECEPVEDIVNNSTFSTGAKTSMLSEFNKLSLPLTVDTDIMSPEISHSRQFNRDIYDAVDFAIVPETTGNVTRGEFFITEKTIKCILTNTKFIAVACLFYIKQLKEYFYTNFNKDISHLTDWCDTSYDEIENTEERIKKVVEIAHSLVNK